VKNKGFCPVENNYGGLMKLSAWLKENKMTQKQFLESASRDHSAGFSYHALVKWCSGQRIPRAEDMKVIHEATNGNVTPNDFYPLQ
jgi:hypothetical protein